MIKKLQKNKGFVLLFAVTLAAILLSIALGVSNIAFKEIKFGTSAKDTNEAFFAADTGVEFALFQDKDPSNYPSPDPEVGETSLSYSEIVPSLGDARKNCAIVSITKDVAGGTTIISKGYNLGDGNCNSTNSDRIEREIKTTY